MYPRCYHAMKKDISNTSGMCVFKDEHAVIRLFSSILPNIQTIKVTVSDCCKFSIEFLFSTINSLLKLNEGGKDKSKDVNNFRSESLLQVFS